MPNNRFTLGSGTGTGSSNPSSAVPDRPTISILNEFMHLYCLQELSKLNKNVVQQSRMPGNTYNIVEYRNDAAGWQAIPNDEDAFNLNPPISGTVTSQVVPAEAFISRKMFGYVWCTRLAQGTYEDFVAAMEPFVLSLLGGLQQIKGYGPETRTAGRCYISFDRPGTIMDYFREVEYSAGYELRVMSDCVRTNILRND